MKTKIIFFLIFLSTGIFFSYKTYRNHQQIKSDRISLENKKQTWLNLKKILENKVMHFRGNVSLVIRDLNTNWEIDFNKDTLMPSASLVKIPIMLSCFYAAQDGKIHLTDTVSLKASEKVSGSRVLGRDPAGSTFTVEELLKPMITQSDNAAANVLIDFLGFDTLNAYFKKIGLKNTNLARKMMDFEERKEGEENYTTAEDMAFILEGLYHKKFLNKEVSEKCLELLRQQKINDRIPRKLPKDGIFIAHKTGLERHICHDVGIVFTHKGNFLICVLVKHDYRRAKSAKKLISDVALLTYNYYQSL
jgi:beta-lactamase class A